MTGPKGEVAIVEVGPRDGLQNEKATIDSAVKVELVRRLVSAGLRTVEVTSFVRPDVIPQLADASDVLAEVLAYESDTADVEDISYPVLVPNLRGYERARESGASSIALFTAASGTFSQRNTNASVAETIDRFAPVVERAQAEGVSVRGYISCAFGCPYEGEVAPAAVHDVARRLAGLGIVELSVGDTIGVGTPAQVEPVCAPLFDIVPTTGVGLHLHDTRGTALSNVWQGLQIGITTFDASVAGLGGCPFAPGASGNLATEDLVWFLHRNGYDTGVDLAAVIDTARWISAQLGRSAAGRVANARLWPDELTQ